MKLETLKIKNYRAYAGEHAIEVHSNFTAFIGKNDAGKSTVFDALDVFVGNKKPDLGDLNTEAEERVIEISAVFSDLPEEIEIDAGAVTKLQDEYLLNKDGKLEVKKVFKCTATAVSSAEICIVADYPDQEQIEPLHKLNNTSLKVLGESKGVAVADKKVNHLWRKAIWASTPKLRTVPTDLKIEEFETKAKRIYLKLEEHMPLVFVFRTDREMTDADSEAKDPMQIAVAEAQKIYKKEISEIEEKIQKKVDTVATLALKKLHEMHPTLAERLEPVRKSKPAWKFDYRIQDDRGIALNKRGSGTRRLVLLNFLRAQAEQKTAESNQGIIYAIEEPETSQHPDNQMLLINALIDLAVGDRQVLITTHSPELLRKVKEKYVDGIRFVQTNDSGLKEIIHGNDALVLAAGALGILSVQMFGSAEKVILVEGKTDCLFLEHAAQAMKDAGELTGNLQELRAEALPVGGCGGVQDWISLDTYSRLGLPTYVFLDSDRMSAGDPVTQNENYVQSLATVPNISGAFCTSRREIENYIDQNLMGCTFGEYDDVKAIAPPVTGVSKNKLIDVYWVKMQATDIDQEIKDIITQIVS